MKLHQDIAFPANEKEALRVRYGTVLAALGHENPDVVALDADLSTSTQTAVFGKEFPARHFDMGIAEADMIGTAAGMAASGLIPFASSFAVFAVGRAYDQIRNAVAYADLPVRIVATHAGITVGEDGGSHQMLEDIAMMRVLPNMHVIVPADANETEAAIRFAAGFAHPLYVRLSREKFPVLYTGIPDFTLGRWDVLAEGDGGVVLIACGIMVSLALEAAALLEKDGIAATVINASSIKPHDVACLENVCQTASLVVTLEEALIAGGLGGLVAEEAARHGRARVHRIGVTDRFGESGTSAALMEAFGFTAGSIADDVRQQLSI